MFSSENNKWSTPRSFFEELNKEFNFTLDPCCTEKSALCKKFYTPKEDGLKQSWAGERVFVNPPYNKPENACIQPYEKCKKKICEERGYHIDEYIPGKVDWIKKCYYEMYYMSADIVVALLPVRTDEVAFHEYIYELSEIRFIKGRLKFVDMDTGHDSTPAPFPSMLVIWR